MFVFVLRVLCSTCCRKSFKQICRLSVCQSNDVIHRIRVSIVCFFVFSWFGNQFLCREPFEICDKIEKRVNPNCVYCVYLERVGIVVSRCAVHKSMPWAKLNEKFVHFKVWITAQRKHLISNLRSQYTKRTLRFVFHSTKLDCDAQVARQKPIFSFVQILTVCSSEHVSDSALYESISQPMRTKTNTTKKAVMIYCKLIMAFYLRFIQGRKKYGVDMHFDSTGN